MKPIQTTLITGLACAAAIATAIWAWRARATANDARKETARLATLDASLAKKLSAAQERFKRLDEEFRAAQAALAEAKATQTATTVRAASLARIDKTAAIRREHMKNDPQYQSAWYGHRRLSIGHTYGAFFQKHKLPPEKADLLTEALIQREVTLDDIDFATAAQGLSPDDPAALAHKETAENEYKAAVLAALGPELAAQFDKYDRQTNIRQIMLYHAGALSQIGAPMTLDQSERLVDIIASTSPTFMNGGSLNGTEIDWDAVDEQAKNILTPVQYDMFTKSNPYGAIDSRWRTKFNRTLNALIAAGKQDATDPAPSQ